MRIPSHRGLIPGWVWMIVYLISMSCTVKPFSSQNQYQSFVNNYQQLSTGMTADEVRAIFKEPSMIETNDESDQTWVYHISYQAMNPMTYALWYQRAVEVCNIYLYVYLDGAQVVTNFSYTSSDDCDD